MISPVQHAMASAALRHVRDARRLCEGAPPSLDQAWHLAGFGPECARKAALSDASLHQRLGHDLDDPELTGWALALDAGAQRWAWTPAPTTAWRPSHRYDPTGTRGIDEVRPFVVECEGDTLEIVGRLWCGGIWTGAQEGRP